LPPPQQHVRPHMAACARTATAAVLLLVVVFAPRSVADEQPLAKRVLVLYQDAPNVPVLIALNDGLRRVLQEADGVTVYTEHLDLSRFPGPSFVSDVRGWLRHKYTPIGISLVVAVAPGAITVATQPDALWPGVPLVFCATDERLSDDFARIPGVTGIAQHYPIGETMGLALRLLPNTSKLVLVGGAAPNDRVWESLLRAEAAKLTNKVEVVELFGLPLAELREQLAAIPRGTPVVGVSFLRDGAGRLWTGPEIIRAIDSAAPGPVFSIYEVLVGRGSVGGVVVDYARMGEETGRLALRVMDSRSTGGFPLQRDTASKVVLDGRILDRWNIPDARLPPGAEVRFRVPPPWAAYPRTSIAIAIAVGIQTSLMVVVLLERRSRRRAEALARERQSAVAHMNRVAAVSEIAASLAHEINTPIASMLNGARAVRRFLATQGVATDQGIQRSLSIVESEGQRVADIIRRLRSMLRKEGTPSGPMSIVEIVREAVALVEPQAKRQETEILLEASPEVPSVEGDRIQLLQVVLNLLLNAIDAVGSLPASQRRVVVSATFRDDQVEVMVADTGQGFTPAARSRLFEPFFTTKPSGLGLGLSISRSIVEAHGGCIYLGEKPGGAVIFVRLPAVEEAAAVATGAV